jgi:formylglycine-generating enzyme required for sulfatase activity
MTKRFLRAAVLGGLVLILGLFLGGCPTTDSSTDDGPVYTVTVIQPEEGGTISASPESGVEGTEITLTLFPATDDWELMPGSLRYSDDTETYAVDEGTKKFSLPAANVRIRGAFQKKSDSTIYEITIDPNIANGTISASPESGTVGTEITLTINSESPYSLMKNSLKYTYVHSEGTGEYFINQETRKFLLPARNITVTGTFDNFYTVTINPALADYVQAEPSSGAAGTEIMLNLVSEDWHLLPGTLTYNAGFGNTPVSVGTRTFTLPAADVTVSGTVENLADLHRRMIRVTGATVTAPIGIDSAPVGPSPFFNADTVPVTVDSFSIGATEVSYQLWWTVKSWATDAARDDKRYTFTAIPNSTATVGADFVKSPYYREEPRAEYRYHPVNMVAWWDAAVWCNAYSEWEAANGTHTDFAPLYIHTDETIIRNSTISYIRNKFGTDRSPAGLKEIPANARGYRLPTHTESEYAARGGDPSAPAWSWKYPGSDAESPGEVAWYLDNSAVGALGPVTHTVGTKLPNTLGIYDLAGNVREFTATISFNDTTPYMIWYGSYYGHGIDSSLVTQRTREVMGAGTTGDGFRVAGPFNY